MRRLISFTQVTLDGYFTGRNGDLSWAHEGQQDAEWNAFVAGNASGGGQLFFGRITYELMVSYWPTPTALERDQSRATADGVLGARLGGDRANRFRPPRVDDHSVTSN